MQPAYIDVHQHLWPPELVDTLRSRTSPPVLREWTLHTGTEAPYEIDPADHDAARRGAQEAAAEAALVSLSAPLGIEDLGPGEAQPLLDAWHAGAAQLPPPFRHWASVGRVEPDVDGLKELFAAGGAVGLQVPATWLATPADLERLAPVLRRCEELDRPVLVHPGPAVATPDVPGWWPALVDYPAQLQAAWWSWLVAGRHLLPGLRICFVAGAGLAPLQLERFVVRAHRRHVVDRDVFVETSSYGRHAVDALTRALGIDAVVLGSDRPYGPLRTDHHLGAAARRAITVTNPTRLLEGDA